MSIPAVPTSPAAPGRRFPVTFVCPRAIARVCSCPPSLAVRVALAVTVILSMTLMISPGRSDAALVFGRVTGVAGIEAGKMITLHIKAQGATEWGSIEVMIAAGNNYSLNLDKGAYEVEYRCEGTHWTATLRSGDRPLRQDLQLMPVPR